MSDTSKTSKANSYFRVGLQVLNMNYAVGRAKRKQYKVQRQLVTNALRIIQILPL